MGNRLRSKKIEWNLTDDDIEKALERIKKDNVDDLSDLHLFLYAKHISSERSPEFRKLIFGEILNPDVCDDEEKSKHENRERQERLKNIVEKGERTLFHNQSGNFFDMFVRRVPVWGDSMRSYVIFRDREELRGAYVERAQISGCCYMHAPIVLQHYLISMTNYPVDMIGMVDMHCYLRQHVSSKQLEAHILYEKGGNSSEFLASLLPNCIMNNFLCSAADRNPKLWVENLITYGPALVSRFSVTDTFRKNEVSFHSFTGNVIGRHAMVLVGYRIDESKYYFLLQNWWKSKPFVEVTSEYLASCNVELHFVTNPPNSIPANIILNNSAYVESEGIDVPEDSSCNEIKESD